MPHLARRFQNYRIPDSSHRTNICLGKRMCEGLTDDRMLSVAIVTDGATISYSATAHQTDLARKSERVLLEHAALCEAIESGTSVLNA